MPTEEESNSVRGKKPDPLPIKQDAENHVQSIKSTHATLQEAAAMVPGKVVLGMAGLSDAHPRTLKILEQCLSSGEPFIVFRAKDIFTPMVIAHYVGLIEQIQPGDSEQQEALLQHRDEIVTWQRANSSRVRYPD